MYEFNLNITELNIQSLKLKNKLKNLSNNIDSLYNSANNITLSWIDSNADDFLKMIKKDCLNVTNLIDNIKLINKKIFDLSNNLILIVRNNYYKIDHVKIKFSSSNCSESFEKLEKSKKYLHLATNQLQNMQIPLDFEYRNQLFDFNKEFSNYKNRIASINAKNEKFSNEIKIKLNNLQTNLKMIDDIKLKKNEKSYIWKLVGLPSNNINNLKIKEKYDIKNINFSSNLKAYNYKLSKKNVNLKKSIDKQIDLESLFD